MGVVLMMRCGRGGGLLDCKRSPSYRVCLKSSAMGGAARVIAPGG